LFEQRLLFIEQVGGPAAFQPSVCNDVVGGEVGGYRRRSFKTLLEVIRCLRGSVGPRDNHQ
jgi:hypothetical protein